MEGKAILVGDILELDIPSKYFFSGTIAQNLSEVVEDHHPLYTSFLVWSGLFPPLTRTKTSIVPSVLFSLKTLEDHLLWLKEFAQTMGNILIDF